MLRAKFHFKLVQKLFFFCVKVQLQLLEMLQQLFLNISIISSSSAAASVPGLFSILNFCNFDSGKTGISFVLGNANKPYWAKISDCIDLFQACVLYCIILQNYTVASLGNIKLLF